ncbi:unnamed protein product [Bathycoccus prasinos]
MLFLKTILSRVYFFFALFPSPFFGGPFPLLFIRSNFTFRLLSSGSSNSMSIFRIPSGYHDVNRGPTNAFFKSFLPVGTFVSFNAVWNILAATRAIFFLFAATLADIALDLAIQAFLLSRRVCAFFLRVFFWFSSQSFHTKNKKKLLLERNKMDSEEEKKEDRGEHINLKVKDQDNAEVHFKVKMGTKFKKIFDAFLQRKSLQPGSVRFLFDGERVREDQTPQELDMEDGDSLDVMMEQVGGK